MTWIWPYLLGVLTMPALAFIYAVVVSARTNPKARQGLFVLAFGLAVLAVVFLAGMNFTAWREAIGW
jgi:hypothetical protein